MHGTSGTGRALRRSWVAGFVALAAAAPHAAAEIIIDPTRAGSRSGRFDITAGAVGGETVDNDDFRRERTDADRDFTTFTGSGNLNASSTGDNGTATGRIAGSGTADIALADDVLTITASASFDARGRFTLANSPQGNRGGGTGDGDFTFSVPFSVTERPYEFSYAGSHSFAMGTTGAARTGSSRVEVSLTSTNSFFADLRRSGSGRVEFGDSGLFTRANDSFGVSFNVGAGAGPAGPGQSDAHGDFNVTLTLRPAGRWIDPAGGSFQDTGNWTAGFVPRPQDVAVFDLPGTYTVALAQDTTTHGLRVGGASAGAAVNVTYDLDGRRYTLNEINLGTKPNDNISVTVRGGDGGPAVSSARGGVAVTGQTQGQIRSAGITRVGAGARYSVVDGVAAFSQEMIADGGVAVRDLGTRFEAVDFFLADAPTAGATSSATLEVKDAATLVTTGAEIGSRAAASGHAFVDGAESLWQVAPNGSLDVGGAGRGRVEITNGGALIAPQGDVVLGADAGSDGGVDVADPGSTLEARDLIVGAFGTGTLQVIRGGAADVDTLHVGAFDAAAGTVRVGGEGSEINVSQLLSVAGPDSNNSTATLEIGNGGNVTASQTVVGNGGRITVESSPLVTETSFGTERLVVESGGQLSLSSGGFAIASETATVGGGSGAGGALSSVHVNNSRFRVGDVLTLLPGGTATAVNNGEISVGDVLRVDAGASLTVEPDGGVNVGDGNAVQGALRVGPNGTLSGAGNITTPNLVNAGGTVSPGSSPGILAVTGDYVQEPAGLLLIEVAGTVPGALHDVLAITGDAAIDGNLDLVFVDGFAPRAGDRFAFLDVGGDLTGEFDLVRVRNLAPGFKFDLSRDGGGMTLVARNDGVFVPEPGAAGLMLLACAGLLRRRRRGRC